MPDLTAPGSRVVLVGTQSCADGSDLPPIAAVKSTMDDLRRVLTTRCGVSTERITSVLDAPDPMTMSTAIAEAADQATDVLLVHYVGHGFVGSDRELYLATKATDRRPNRLEHSSVRYPIIRESLLNSRARALVVILDCCYSGRAFHTLSAQEPIDLADVTGGYVLTSADRDELALALPGEQHTAFTGELIRLLDTGDPDGPAEFSIRDVYRALDRQLLRRGRPRPRQRGSERINDLVLARNPAHGKPLPPPSPLPPLTESDGQRAVRRKKRMLTALVISGIMSASAVPVVWYIGSGDPPTPRTPRPPVAAPFTPPSNPANPTPSPEPPAQPPASPPRSDPSGLPAAATAWDAAGNFVTLVRGPQDRVQRFVQKQLGKPVGTPDDLGCKIAHGTLPVVVHDSSDHLAAFAVGEDGRLQYNPDIMAADAKDSWHALPESVISGLHGTPTAAQDSVGRLHVFARGPEQQIYHTRQNEAGSDSWTPAAPMKGTRTDSDPKAYRDANNALRMFALTTDNTLHTWAEKRAGSDDWSDNPVGAGTKLTTPPAVTKTQDGHLYLSALDAAGHVWQITENDPPNTWPEQWEPHRALSQTYTGQPKSATDSHGRPTVFVRPSKDPHTVTYASPGDARPGAPIPVELISVTSGRNRDLVVQGWDNDTKMISREVPG